MIWLNYVGKVYGNNKEFIKEARKNSAQRACSYFMLKTLVRNKSIIYYARYSQAQSHVFAYGRVIGFSTTMPISEYLHGGTWQRVRRRCGSYYARRMNVYDLDAVLEEIEKRSSADERLKHKWFINTDITEYDSTITNIITYTKRGMVVSDIAFTRSFICLFGKNTNENEAESVWEIKQYKPYNGKVFTPKKRKKKEEDQEHLEEWM